MAITCSECGGLGEIPEPALDTTIRSRTGKLERGWRRTWLIDKLAKTEATHDALARALGVGKSAVGMFAMRHREEIDARRVELTQALTNLWITDKLHRLAEYQQDVQDINDIVEEKLEAAQPAPFNPLDPANDGKSTPSATDDLPAWLRVKTAILRAAAEELGQLPQRVNVQVGGSVVTYKVEGVDMEALR